MLERTYTYKTVGSCMIQADVFRVDDDRIRPVIMWIHGGALINGSRNNLGEHERQIYVNEGYVVVSIDYRLAPETKLPYIIEDLQDAYRWVCEQGPELFRIDPERIAVAGSSAGGYLTLMTGFCVKPRPRALVSFYGYGDIAGKWYAEPDDFYNRSPRITPEEAYSPTSIGTQEISMAEKEHFSTRGVFYPYCRQNGLWPMEVAGRDPKTDPRFFDAYCPIRNVTPVYPPTLLLHGDADTDVPFEQSAMMAEELARVGVEHELVRYPGAGHGLGEGYRDSIARAAAFLKKHIGFQ